jgi:hypothetical protein
MCEQCVELDGKIEHSSGYHCEESKPAKSKKLHRSVLRQFNTKIWLHYWVKVTYPADTAVSQFREASPSHVRKSVVTRASFYRREIKAYPPPVGSSRHFFHQDPQAT